ncbi:MAG TPA: MerR family transcriptional regulator [Pyrinomonadaceae bacterium]|jgi:DNA-binding transcriptional MerR regulator|nr:MerR family transcriptional regulator [Pyrinomonadaceae bacterium]
MNRAAVPIPEKLFFKIGEVCDITDVQAHVLRYWESEFPMLAPQKNRAGQRTYRKRDVEMVLRIKELLYEDQYTIAGAKKKLAGELRGASKLKVVTPEMSATLTAAPQPPPPIPSLNASASLSSSASTAPLVAQPRVNFESAPPTPEGDTQLSDERHLAVRRLRQELRELLMLLSSDETSGGTERR